MIDTQVAVIGAGMAGLTVAKALQERGMQVHVFEKARGSGGRLSSKALTLENDERVTFDLGCTHFQVTTDAFREFLAPLVDAGKAGQWPSDNQYIGLTRNSALTRALADNLPVSFSKRIVALSKNNEGKWQLWEEATSDSEQSGQANHALLAEADQVILAVPPEQAEALLPNSAEDEFASLREYLSTQAYVAPQWVVGMVLKSDVAVDLSAIYAQGAIKRPVSNVIDQVCIETAKPGRSAHAAIQIQAGVQWTQERLNWAKEEVAAELIFAVKNLMPDLAPLLNDYQGIHVHRWLYSIPQPSLSNDLSTDSSTPAYLSSHLGLHLCGDYFLASGKLDGVESAFLSGQRLAGALINELVVENADN